MRRAMPYSMLFMHRHLRLISNSLTAIGTRSGGYIACQIRISVARVRRRTAVKAATGEPGNYFTYQICPCVTAPLQHTRFFHCFSCPYLFIVLLHTGEPRGAGGGLWRRRRGKLLDYQEQLVAPHPPHSPPMAVGVYSLIRMFAYQEN